MIEFNCPQCHAKFQVDDELAGAAVSCSECNCQFEVPRNGGDVPAPETGEPALPATDDTPFMVTEAKSISFNCPQCHAHFECEADMEGCLVSCSLCNCQFNVPRASPETVDDASASFAKPQETVPGSMTPDLPDEASPTADMSAKVDFPQKPAPVPPSPVPSIPSAAAPRLPPRQRRLAADYRMMQVNFTDFPLIHLERAEGNPPERYVISFHVRGIERLQGGLPVYRSCHEVEIRLPGTYPRTPPICRMLTPIFHPNIEPAIICLGDHWTASERLCDLVVRIGEMIAYQAHNIKSPLDGEAAMWTDLHADMLPIDGRDMTPPENER